MTDVSTTDVLIIGAGPTGLTLACDLARRGVACRIVEQAPEPNRASKGKKINSRSIEVFDDLGAVEHVLRTGTAELPIRFHERSGTVTERPPIGTRADESSCTPYPDGLWLGQFDTEYALRRRLAELGGAVEFGAEAVDLDQDESGATTLLRTPEGDRSVRARYVVAADGGKSTTRKLAGLPMVGETIEQQRWYLGDVTVPALDRSRMHIWPSEHGMLGLTPLPGSDLWQFQSPIPAGVEPGTPSLEWYQQLFDERAGEGAVVLDSATWLSVYQVNVRMVEDYRSGRVLLAGDAAHVHPPAGGQGMNTGIQDAYNLGWKLASVLGGGALPDLLDTYSAERMPVARTVLAVSTRKMSETMDKADRSTEDGLGSAIADISDEWTTGLGIHYRTGPLAYSGGAQTPAGPAAGDRAPNVSGLEGEQGTRELFDLMRGPHWTVLLHEHTEPVVFDQADPALLQVHRIGSAPAGAIADGKGEFQRIYRPVPGELIFIRPDGYIAARTPADQVSGVVEHLAAFRSHGSRVHYA
ncbi:FAD-dependent oxidoreductase [Streptomonospora sediminis]